MAAKTYKIIGLMSGTSLDGIDVALIETDGQSITAFGPSLYCAYDAAQQEELRQIMTDALAWNFNGPMPNHFAEAEREIDAAHILAVKRFANKFNIDLQDIDYIGYHGQTVLHHAASRSRKGQTLQLGDGARLAEALGVDCIYDFRSADVAAGGQGAPLAPAFHAALLKLANLPRAAVLNIGGVSNVTALNFSSDIIASDCGPGNGPLDSWVLRRTGRAFDAGGKLALSGTPDIGRIENWLSRPFFNLPTPRSADRYDFDVLSEMHELSTEDGAATLTAFIAEAVVKTFADMDMSPAQIIVCGGGRHNPLIMGALQSRLPAHVVPCEDLGWEGDALEAQAFAFLAARHVSGLPLSFPGTTGVSQPITGGQWAKAR